MAKIDGVQEVRLADLVPYERNAKQHSAEQVQKIADSIKEFGFLSPVLIDRETSSRDTAALWRRKASG